MEAAMRPRALNLGGILNETLRVYSRDYRSFVVIVASVQLPLVIVQVLLQSTIQNPQVFTGKNQAIALAALGATFGLVLVLLALLLVGSSLMYAAGTYAASQSYLGGSAAPALAYDAVLGRVGSVVGVSVLVGLVVFLLSITIIGFPAAIYFLVRWAFYIPAIVLEGTGATASLSRSTKLVAGDWWRVFGILLVLFLIEIVAVLLGTSILNAIFGAAIRDEAGRAVLSTIFSTALNILIGALSIIGLTILYYDLRLRKEGFVA